jgi:uncharacterized protein YegP (UPF0339 family)
MGAYFRVFQDTAGQFRFNLHAPNNEKILHSEGYVTKDGCLFGIASVRLNNQTDANYHRFTDTAGKYRFHLRAQNGEIIGHSEAYESAAMRENGIASVKLNAPISIITGI